MKSFEVRHCFVLAFLCGSWVFFFWASSSAAQDHNYLHAPMPWHDVVLDFHAKLLAWYHPEKNLGYDQVFRFTWDFLEHKVPLDTAKGTNLKIHLTFPIFQQEICKALFTSHLLRSSSVVQNVKYEDRKVAYQTFDDRGVAILRLRFKPLRVIAGDKMLNERSDLRQPGYTCRCRSTI